jgi:hypothetical protein
LDEVGAVLLIAPVFVLLLLGGQEDISALLTQVVLANGCSIRQIVHHDPATLHPFRRDSRMLSGLSLPARQTSIIFTFQLMGWPYDQP